MTARVASRAEPLLSEEGRAAVRTMLTVTAAIGGMTGLVAVAAGDAPLVIAPTVALAATLAVAFASDWATGAARFAAAAGAAVWLVLVPTAGGEAILVPLGMAAACATVAIGPARVAAFLAADAVGHEDAGDAPSMPAAEPAGWIEDLDPADATRRWRS